MARRNARYAVTCLTVLLFVVALAAVGLLFPAGLKAQDTLRAPSAALLRRIAEAVAGQTTPGIVFVVAGEDSGVAGVERTRAAALDLARRLGRDYNVFGPFRKPEFPTVLERAPAGCVHHAPTSNMVAICNHMRPLLLSQIRSMSLVVRMHDGTTRTIDLPSGTDAFVLSAEAYDKFVFPYYQRLLGVEGATTLRRGHLGAPSQ